MVPKVVAVLQPFWEDMLPCPVAADRRSAEKTRVIAEAQYVEHRVRDINVSIIHGGLFCLPNAGGNGAAAKIL